jgi:transposase
LLRASFVPPAPVRELRELTRSRRPLIPEHAREVNRIQKVLETAAKGRLHAKVAPLQEALIGRVTPHHAFLLGALLSHVEFLRTADRALRFSEDPPRILGEVIDHARQGQLAAERAVRQK